MIYKSYYVKLRSFNKYEKIYVITETKYAYIRTLERVPDRIDFTCTTDNMVSVYSNLFTHYFHYNWLKGKYSYRTFESRYTHPFVENLTYKKVKDNIANKRYHYKLEEMLND